MDSIIERLRTAKEPDRELDALIWAELDGRDVRVNDNNLVLAKSRRAPHDECLLGYIDPGKHSRNFGAGAMDSKIPRYTFSIDAALTLVPSYCIWTLEPCAAWVRYLDRDDVKEFQGYGDGFPMDTAVALCLAALQARAAH